MSYSTFTGVTVVLAFCVLLFSHKPVIEFSCYSEVANVNYTQLTPETGILRYETHWMRSGDSELVQRLHSNVYHTSIQSHSQKFTVDELFRMMGVSMSNETVCYTMNRELYFSRTRAEGARIAYLMFFSAVHFVVFSIFYTISVYCF